MELTTNDYQNLLALLTRVQFNGLAEAEAATVLAQKLRMKLQPQEANGDLPNNH